MLGGNIQKTNNDDIQVASRRQKVRCARDKLETTANIPQAVPTFDLVLTEDVELLRNLRCRLQVVDRKVI